LGLAGMKTYNQLRGMIDGINQWSGSKQSNIPFISQFKINQFHSILSLN